MQKSRISKAHAKRRQQLLKAMGDGAALIFTAPVLMKSQDNALKFRPDSYFYYLTGFSESAAALILYGNDKAPYRLYVRPCDPHHEQWNGKSYGVEGAVNYFGADQAWPLSQLETDLKSQLRHMRRLHYAIGLHAHADKLVLPCLQRHPTKLKAGEKVLSSIHNPLPLLDEMRLIKDADEIALIQKACDISAQAYHQVMRQLKDAKHEYEVQALLEYHMRCLGGQGPAFNSIVAGGVHATTLHYESNQAPLKAGELLLIDTGCEYGYYASDVTRTLPISGQFSPAQAKIYNLVLQAQQHVIKVIRPGVRYEVLNKTAGEILARGLIELKICKGTVAQVLKSEEFKRYYPHGIGHWLGLDVHDVGSYQESDGKSRILKRGMVLTVEPGLYFAADDKRVPAIYRGIGVRIEDDVEVTATGNRVLTQAIPKEIAEIEAAMHK